MTWSSGGKHGGGSRARHGGGGQRARGRWRRFMARCVDRCAVAAQTRRSRKLSLYARLRPRPPSEGNRPRRTGPVQTPHLQPSPPHPSTSSQPSHLHHGLCPQIQGRSSARSTSPPAPATNSLAGGTMDAADVTSLPKSSFFHVVLLVIIINQHLMARIRCSTCAFDKSLKHNGNNSSMFPTN